jgi:hypothetical protein
MPGETVHHVRDVERESALMQIKKKNEAPCNNDVTDGAEIDNSVICERSFRTPHE